MNEDYVSHEVAKLLKEKGFAFTICKGFAKYSENEMKKIAFYQRPTLYMAQEWLRKEKGIYVWVEPVVGHKWTVSFCDLNVSAEESDWIERELHKDGYPIYNTFEEALQTGILEALKLII